MPLGVGLIGFGLAGRSFHAPLLAASGLRVVAVATSRRDELRARLPGVEACAVGDLIVRPDVDLVVVASPNAVHVEQAETALLAGKHVVVDKPAAPTTAEVRRLDALAQERGLVASVFHNRRWDADFLTMKALLDRGAVGEPVRYSTSWNRRKTSSRTAWRDTPGPGAGVLYDLGSHLIDQALTLFGRPDWIQADVSRQRADGAAEPDDGFEVLLGKGRLRISLAACSLASGPARTIRLDGDAASFVKQGFDPQEERLRAGADPAAPDFGDEPDAAWGALWNEAGASPVRSESGRWTAFYDGVRRAIEDGAPAPVTMAQATATIEIIELALQSARTGRRLAPAAL